MKNTTMKPRALTSVPPVRNALKGERRSAQSVTVNAAAEVNLSLNARSESVR